MKILQPSNKSDAVFCCHSEPPLFIYITPVGNVLEERSLPKFSERSILHGIRKSLPELRRGAPGLIPKTANFQAYMLIGLNTA